MPAQTSAARAQAKRLPRSRASRINAKVASRLTDPAGRRMPWIRETALPGSSQTCVAASQPSKSTPAAAGNASADHNQSQPDGQSILGRVPGFHSALPFRIMRKPSPADRRRRTDANSTRTHSFPTRSRTSSIRWPRPGLFYFDLSRSACSPCASQPTPICTCGTRGRLQSTTGDLLCHCAIISVRHLTTPARGTNYKAHGPP